MKKNTINCPQKDYDFYTIPFPVKALFGPRREHYIFSELEKLHPCFSNDCSYDTHFRIEKSGLKADVVVMQKYKVAEYKANKTNLVFKESVRHHFFAQRKRKAVYLFLTAAVLLIIVLVYTINLFSAARQSDLTESQLTQTYTEPEPSLQQKELLILHLLNDVSTNGGTVSDFSWHFDGYNETAAMLVKGLFPEQFMGFDSAIKLSSMTFDAYVPVIPVSFNEHYVVQAPGEPSLCETKRNALRKVIVENNLELMEETVQPLGIKFIAQNNQSLKTANLISFLEQNNMPVSDLKINSSQNQIKIEIVFSSVNLAGLSGFYECIKNNMKLFFTEQENTMPQEMFSQTVPLQTAQPQQTLLKIGQIIKPDGYVITWYKDENGKIVKR